MHRFFVAPEDCQAQEFILPDHEAHHALHVLRVRPGDRLTVLDGIGHELLCEITTTTKHAVHLRLVQRSTSPPLPSRITLIQAVPKPKAMDFIVQKATELGTSRIVPVQSERTVGQWQDESAAHKAVKWRTGAIEAAKQCGTPWLPTIESPVSVTQFLERREHVDLHLVASLQPGAVHPRQHFTAFFNEHRRRPGSIAVWVGPEGDFTPSEINAIRSAGALPITLGPLVLRSETAALYCLSVLTYELSAADH